MQKIQEKNIRGVFKMTILRVHQVMGVCFKREHTCQHYTCTCIIEDSLLTFSHLAELKDDNRGSEC